MKHYDCTVQRKWFKLIKSVLEIEWCNVYAGSQEAGAESKFNDKKKQMNKTEGYADRHPRLSLSMYYMYK
jgi:hypothetical protein